MSERFKPTPPAGPPCDLFKSVAESPAFPLAAFDVAMLGMDHRTVAALVAMHAVLSSSLRPTTIVYENVAEVSVTLADALLAELSKPAEGK